MKDFPGGPLVKSPHFPTHILIDRWMDKETVVPIHMKYYSAIKNAFESVLMRRMILEPIIKSEVSQKENDSIIY